VTSVIAADPNGYLAALAYVRCALGTETKGDYLAESLGQQLEKYYGFRGPHMAALTTIARANLELDSRGDSLKFPPVGLELMSANHTTDGGIGVVSGLKAQGEETKVEFERKAVTFPVCTDYKAGTKITAITADGRIERAGTCYKYKDVTSTQEVPPTTTAGRFAAAIKPVMYVVILNGVTWAGWAKGSKEPTMILGAKL
jgi:hypothetical protein